MAHVFRWFLGVLLLVFVFALASDLLGGESVWSFFQDFFFGRIAGLPGWISVLQPLVATVGLVVVGLLAGVAIGVPLGLVWGRHHWWAFPLGIVVAGLLGAFPLGLCVFFLHLVIVDFGWTVPGYLCIDSGGGLGVAGRYLLGVACLAPLAAGEIAVVVRGEVRRAVGDRRQEFARSLGMSRRAVFPRWAIPPALVATLASLPMLVAVLFSWAAAIEWVFRIGGLGRVVVESALTGDLSGSLLGILVLAMMVSVLRSIAHASSRGEHWRTVPIYSQRNDFPPGGWLKESLSRRLWWWRIGLGTGLLVFLPLALFFLSSLLPTARWDEAFLSMEAILGRASLAGGEAGAEAAAGYGALLVGRAVCAGYGALCGGLLSAFLGVFWGIAAAVVKGRLMQRVLGGSADFVSSVPMALLLLVLVIPEDAGVWGPRCVLVVLLAARVARGVARTVPEMLSPGYLEAASSLPQHRLVTLREVLRRPVLSALPGWVVSTLHWWLYVPAMVAFLNPSVGLSFLGAAAGRGMETLWETPLVVFAPCLLLGILGAGFHLSRILLPDRSIDGRISLR